MHHEGMTNTGKKETRQINQVIDKQTKEGDRGAGGQREAGSRTNPREHRLDGQKQGK